MKKLLILGAVLITVPFASFAQTGSVTGTPTAETAVVADAGLLPGDFFYFFDRWTEALNLALTFNNEKKARKHLEYAKERISEMSKVLENPSAKFKYVKSAKEDFDEDILDAATLVKEEKGKGADVSKLARELDDELDDARDALEDVIKKHIDRSSHAEEEIRAKLALLSPTDPQFQGLSQALESIIKEKNEASKEKDELDDDHDIFENEMGSELSAKKHIENAVREKAHLEEKFGPLSAGVSASFNELLKQANTAFMKGDFEGAKNLAKQAKKLLEKTKDVIEKANDEMKNKLEKEMEGRGVLNMGMPIMGREDVNEMEVYDLEEDIRKSERMMEGIGR